MADLRKAILIFTTKEIGRRAIPYLLIIPFLILIHLLLLALWYYYHQDLSRTFLIFIGVFGIVLPPAAYIPWGIRRFIASSYLVIHNNLIQPQLHPFCKKTAEAIFENSFNNSAIPDHLALIAQWKTKTENYLNKTPSIVQFITRRVTRKLSFTHSLVDKLKLISREDTDGIANLLNQELSLAMVNTSKNSLPKWTVYLIPLTLIFYLFIWFV